MTFDEVLDQVRELLQSKGRVTYRSLKRRFELDDEYLEDLKGELIRAEGVATDEDGDVLVWTGGATKSETSKPPASSDTRPQTLDARPTDGERRQLTVEFIDLVGSTTLSQQLDPEDYHARVVAYQTACHQVIARYDGHIAQYLGDGVLVYFGYPAAHEDDAVRAVRSGLEIVAAVSQLKFTPPLQVRIGIHTGPVVVGEIGAGERPERLALGETPNIAARVQGHAESNEVMISATTYHLIEGLFACEDHGWPALKGVTTPLTLYRVVQAGEAHSRFEVVVRRGLTPLIGRDPEFGLLQERWARVKDGTGQVVLLSGEPGIGKSRLVEALKEMVEHARARCLELRCSPYAQNSALAPVIEHVQRLLQFSPTDGPKTKLEKLHQALSRYRFPQADAFSLLAAVLSLPLPDDVPSLPLSPQKQKEKTQEVLVACLCEEARQQAVTYAWEDLHWADPSTLELLTLFLAQVPTTRLLVVLTYRPEFTPPWGSHSYVSQLTLSRLAQTQVGVMVEKVTGGKALPPEVVRQIASKTDGVPLFVEELTKMVMESDLVKEVNGHYELSGPLPPLAIPSTLQDSLMARLDRLAAVREIAQIGATIGREFNYDLLQAVSTLNEEALQQGLRQLVEAELVFQSGVPPQARYLFKHALVQDTAYQSLLKSRRQQLHQQVAQVLTEQFSEIIATQPELVAHHYTEAGLMAQAIPYWQQAGQRASQRAANAEAVSHLTIALGLLKTLPDTPARTQQELNLQLALGALLAATKGIAAPEVEHAYRHAQALCEQIGDQEQVFTALFGLTNYYAMRAEHQTACALADQLLSIAQEAQDPALLVAAHFLQGNTRLWIGEFLASRSHLEQGMVLYDPQQHRALAFRYGRDLGIGCRLLATQVLWILGYPDQALQRAQEGLELTRDFSHAFSVASGLGPMAGVHLRRGEWQAAQKRAEAAIVHATEFGLPYFVAQMSIYLGSALAAQGHHEEGITKMRQGLAMQRATGGRILQQLWLALQVEAYIETRQIEEGWTALEEALTIRPKHGDRYWEAELYRLKGELLLAQDRRNLALQGQWPSAAIATEAEACFRLAIETARELSAKSFELRAAMSLARLWQQQGKRAEAHKLLSEIYNWFTEGFDTKDLQEAKRLIEELS